jgi:hypothetical protein
MSTDLSAPAASPSSSDPSPSLLSILGNLLVAPREAFDAIVKNPSPWPALIGAMLLSLSFTALWTSKMDVREFVKEQVEASPRADQIPPDRMGQIVDQQVRMFPFFAWLGPTVGLITFYALAALLYLFLFRFFYGSDINFRTAFAITSWAFFAVAVVTTPLIALVMALKGDWNLQPHFALQANLSLLGDRATTPRWLWTLLESLDLFSFWTMWLLATGFAVATRRTTSGVLAGVAAPWIVYVLGRMALSAIF